MKVGNNVEHRVHIFTTFTHQTLDIFDKIYNNCLNGFASKRITRMIRGARANKSKAPRYFAGKFDLDLILSNRRDGRANFHDIAE